jgi:predicted aspartyl protease
MLARLPLNYQPTDPPPSTSRPRALAPTQTRRWTASLVLLALSVLGACGGDDGGDLATMGMSGIPSSVVVSQNVLLVDAAVDRHPGGRLLADTGSPFTLVDPSFFPGASSSATPQVSVDLTFGALTVDRVPALQVRISGSMAAGAFAGIVGGNVFRQFSTQFDYRGKTFQLGSGAAPTDIATPGGSTAFHLEGGGLAMLDSKTNVAFPATRVSVTVNIEGVDYPFIVDTGASEIAVRSAVFAKLVSDGRTVLEGLPLGTVSGPVQGSVTRAKSVTAAGEMVSNVAVMTIGDTLLDNLVKEVKHPVDGLLGGDFLREFLVTIDYPRQILHLQRYGTRTHIVDEFKRVGIELRAMPVGSVQHYFVSAVFAGSDAATKGVAVGDELSAVDGTALSNVDPVAADELLDGTPGDMRQVTFNDAAMSSLRQATVALRVDDLLPVP